MGTTPTGAQADRASGVLLGQACGDALGVPYEFARPPGPDEPARMRGGGLGPYSPGEFSDDTQMAARIARVAATGADLTGEDALDAVADGFLEWRRDGASDVGIQTSAVLAAAGRGTGRPAYRLRTAARDHAARNPRSAGNGALMRTAVVGLCALSDRARTAAAARAVAELTHADPLAGDSCVLWSEAVRVAVVEGRLDTAGGLDLLPAARRARWAGWLEEATGADPGRFTPNGFTVTALQAAWSAVSSTPVPGLDPAARTFPCQHLQHSLHAAVRIGDDTDTVAAIAGGLLGARWGASAVPAAWRRVVHGWPGLRARDLVSVAVLTARGGRSDGHGWPAGARVAYDDARPRPAVPHPCDDGVWLGTAATTDHDADAVVSLCRVGADEAPAAGVSPADHVEVRLVDEEDPDANPNLEFVLDDTARLVAHLRDEGRRVLVHCVHAEQRTPSVAVAYAVLTGAPPAQAQQMVARALPRCRGRGRIWDAAARVAPAGQ